MLVKVTEIVSGQKVINKHANWQMARNTSVVEVSFSWLPATFCMFSAEPQEIERFKVRDGWKV